MDGSYVPATGDLVFFDWGNDGSVDHVGIVESVVDGNIYTVEGNSGDKVARRRLSDRLWADRGIWSSNILKKWQEKRYDFLLLYIEKIFIDFE